LRFSETTSKTTAGIRRVVRRDVVKIELTTVPPKAKANPR